MVLGHVGLAVTVVGIAFSQSYSVERDTGAGDTAADHEDVEFFGAHALESLSAGCSGQLRLLCKVLGAHMFVLFFSTGPLRGGIACRLDLVKPDNEIITK